MTTTAHVAAGDEGYGDCNWLPQAATAMRLTVAVHSTTFSISNFGLRKAPFVVLSINDRLCLFYFGDALTVTE